MQVYRTRDHERVAVVAATWELNPRVTFESLQAEFVRNPVLAWMNYGSTLLKVQGVTKAVRDPDLVSRCVNRFRHAPWIPEEETFTAAFRGIPGRKYFIHVDLSKNRDGTGIAMVHREPGATGWTVDFMLQLQPVPGREIDIAAIRKNFVVYLHEKREFAIFGVSYDGWQSEESLQQLEQAGFAASYVSVDRSKAPYDTLIGLLNERKLDFYPYAPFEQQVQELELVRGLKYDHPKKFKDGTRGRKDTSDAVAGALANAFAYERDNPESDLGQLFIHRNAGALQRDRYRERSAF